MLQYIALLILSLATIGNAIPPSNGFFRILDYANRSVDLHNRSPADWGPIQSYNSSAGELAQKWLFTAIAGAPNQFSISNAASGTFASYTTAPLEDDPTRSQVCDELEWFRRSDTLFARIVESKSGAVMCAWSFQPTLPSPTSPLTLDGFDPTQIRQVFTFQTCQILIVLGIPSNANILFEPLVV
ncbi:hypothetical protein B0H13DRAFT_1858531 [Mycena leptocephala]|nr:hypothetical protein B0H13DRAFT_1858531 [Mycena leptocephala]